MGLLFEENSKYPALLTALGPGLLGGNTWNEQLANAGMNANAALTAQKQAADAAATKNQTVQMLQANAPELAQAVAAGKLTPNDAFAMYAKQQQEAKEAARPKFQTFDDGSYGWVHPDTQKVDIVGNAAKPVKPDYRSVGDYLFNTETKEFISPPSNMTSNNDKTFDGRRKIAADLGMDPNDAATKQYLATGKFPREDQQALTAVDKKAILEADEMVQVNRQAIDALKQAKSLSSSANSGMLAGTRATIGANLPDVAVPDWISSPDSSTATLDYDNAIVGQALGQLKAIFGGAPTEGERKILLDLQGSANQPAEVRQRILDRAILMAEKRLEFNKQRADELRGGTYYKSNKVPADANNGQQTPSVEDLVKKYGG